MVAAIVVVVVEVVVAAIVVLVVLDVVEVEGVVGSRVGATATGLCAFCHWDSTYAAAPPTNRAMSTSSTIPTLRFERPP